MAAVEAAGGDGPWLMEQRWENLLFLHWDYEPGVIQSTLPRGLEVDTFGGRAWVGVVPFRMAALRPRFLPPVPALSWFWELNVRTYVRDRHGRPGVWFYSLDCDQALACAVARRFFHLNYREAAMGCEVGAGGQRDYWCRSLDHGFAARMGWRPGGLGEPAEVGSLDYFLVERYRLFSYDESAGCLWSGRVEHLPYRVASAEVGTLEVAGLFDSNRLPRPGGGGVRAIASPGVRVRVFGVSRVS